MLYFAIADSLFSQLRHRHCAAAISRRHCHYADYFAFAAEPLHDASFTPLPASCHAFSHFLAAFRHFRD